MPDLTETYQFAPAWFTRLGDGNPLTGLRLWLNDPFAAQAPDDEENHTYFFAEALTYHLLVTAVLWLFSFGDVQDQVLALRTHEAAHEPVIGANFAELANEGRGDDGGLKHVPPAETIDLKFKEVPYGDVMIRRGLRVFDERGLTEEYRKLEGADRIERRVEVFGGDG